MVSEHIQSSFWTKKQPNKYLDELSTHTEAHFIFMPVFKRFLEKFHRTRE